MRLLPIPAVVASLLVVARLLNLSHADVARYSFGLAMAVATVATVIVAIRTSRPTSSAGTRADSSPRRVGAREGWEW